MLLKKIKDDACILMYNKTFYYNSYSGEVYDTMHYENHKEALLHHLVDIRMLLNNRGISLPSADDHDNLPFIEAVLIDTIPVKFGVEDKKGMVLKYAKEHDLEPDYALKLYKALMGALTDKIGLSTLVFTGWLNTRSGMGYHIVVSEII